MPQFFQETSERHTARETRKRGSLNISINSHLCKLAIKMAKDYLPYLRIIAVLISGPCHRSTIVQLL